MKKNLLTPARWFSFIILMIKEMNTVTVSEEQKNEILERDREYEAGEAKSYSLDEILIYFSMLGE